MNRILTTALVGTLGLSGLLFGQTKQQPTAPDNTKVNKQDRNTGAPTADQQKNNRSDIEITAQIRKLLTNDKTLSTNAKNVKVITQNGDVTLRGPVGSAEEKKNVEAKATEIAGATHVKSEIQIAAKQSESNSKEQNNGR